MTFADYYVQSKKLAKQTGQRFGQALFNALEDVRPELANEIRATDKDVFCAPNSHTPEPPWDKVWENFWAFLAERW